MAEKTEAKQFTVRLPIRLIERVKAHCEEKEITVQEFVISSFDTALREEWEEEA